MQVKKEKQRIETAKKTEEEKKRREIEANSKKYKIPSNPQLRA